MPVKPVFLNLSGGDFREAKMAEERKQVDGRAPMQAADILLAALASRDDVVFAEVLLGGLPEGLLGLDFSGAEFPAQLEISILGHFLGFGEAVFLGAAAAIPARKIGRALPATAVRSPIHMNFSAENGVLLRHRGSPPSLLFVNLKM